MSGIEKHILEKYSTFKLHCGQIVKGYYTALWKKQLDIHKDGKLRTYVTFKCNYGFENYLSIIRHFEQRKCITRLRISAHKLQIESGRYQGTLRQNRICLRCTSGEVEDEVHFLFKCDTHLLKREEMMQNILKSCPNFQNLNIDNKLIWIMNNEDPNVLFAFYKYIEDT